LNIDLSEESKMNTLVNEHSLEEISKFNVELTKINSKMESDMKKTKDEVSFYFIKNSKLIEELNNKETKIAFLNGEIKKKDEFFSNSLRVKEKFKSKELQNQMDDKMKIITSLLEKNDKLEKELHEFVLLLE
jgi:hypothetical protein